ncbi:MAG: tRNA (guanosine(46)-N7)-methyltransferase TrmB [Sumerlaeia bacterium]
MHNEETITTPASSHEMEEYSIDQAVPANSYLANWLLDLRTVEKPLNWKKIFGNTNKVELEVGCGTGMFISQYAEDHPKVNLVGLDKCSGIVARSAQKTRRFELENVKLLRFEALYFVDEYVAPKSLQAIHCYYSDPWHKRSHYKRRLWQRPFLEACHKALEEGGMLYMKTDVTDYYSAIQKVFAASADLFEQVLSQRLDEVPLEGDYESNFQLKARAKGHPLYYEVWRKKH